MGKYDSFNRRRQIKAVNETHPIWRGIGCLMLVIVPLISLGFAVLTMDSALRLEWPFPRQFLGYTRMPDFLYNSQVLVPILNAIANVEHLTGYLAFTFIYVIILGAIMSFVYAAVYRLVGPPVYGPLDVPPPKNFRPRRYKR